MKWKSVNRYSPEEKIFRIGRFLWQMGSVGDGLGYSGKLSIGLSPLAFHFSREYEGWILVLLGIRIHFQRSYGGVFV